jgi:phospholipase C
MSTPLVRTAGTALLACLALASCDPQQSGWGLQAIETMSTPPDNPMLGCGVSIPADSLSASRDACSFDTGALPGDTLGIDPGVSAQIPIRHVIIVMKENRSFDHLLGMLAAQGQPGVETAPATYTNADLTGVAVAPFHATTTCIPYDPGHQSLSIQESVDGDNMDGFVRNAAQTTGSDGHFAMSYYDDTDLPFYYFLASTFAIADHHFASLASGTYSNRDFFMFGTNAGAVDTGIVYPSPATPSILQLLMNAKYTWGAYTDSEPFSGALDWQDGSPGLYTMQDLFDALDNGTLPNVAFVDGEEDVEDDHPTADLQVGEAWLKPIYDRAIASPQWPRMAILWTYDEGGAFADHVPPEPIACSLYPGDPLVHRGPRVPMVAISPWAKRNYVSHAVRDHLAITRFIETVFQLPALTARDANSDALLDLFDFSCGRDLSVPAAPEPGTGECSTSP